MSQPPAPTTEYHRGFNDGMRAEADGLVGSFAEAVDVSRLGMSSDDVARLLDYRRGINDGRAAAKVALMKRDGRVTR